MINGINPSEVFLHPGDFHFCHAPGRIGTLLGSCVSVTVWHPQHHSGGMCHILLPGRQRPPGSPPDGHYADEAIERFILELRLRNLAPSACQVKLFGGSKMFSGAGAAGMNIGKRNIEATRQALNTHGFHVMTEHVGGTARRRLFFDLSSGHVWLSAPETKYLP